jgi:3-hydroxy-9,10-secoandrosta-1,3,5(10)-triene-9,17-dione monooxygenase reductase component
MSFPRQERGLGNRLDHRRFWIEKTYGSRQNQIMLKLGQIDIAESDDTVTPSHSESVIRVGPNIVEGISGAELRAAMRHWVTGVTVITASHEGKSVGMVSNSFTSVSLDPPLVSWCVDRGSSSYESWSNTDNFAIHVLSHEQKDFVTSFAKRGGEKFEGVCWHPGIHQSPILDDAILLLECEVWSRVTAGDHLILIGRVLTSTQPENFIPLTNHALFA